MGRKGVSKQKKAKGKVGMDVAVNSRSNGRKPDSQPERVVEKDKTWTKGKKKR